MFAPVRVLFLYTITVREHRYERICYRGPKFIEMGFSFPQTGALQMFDIR